MLLIGWMSRDCFMTSALWVPPLKLWTCFSFLWGFERGDRCFTVPLPAIYFTHASTVGWTGQALLSNTIGLSQSAFSLLGACSVPAQVNMRTLGNIAVHQVHKDIHTTMLLMGSYLSDTCEPHKSGHFYTYISLPFNLCSGLSNRAGSEQAGFLCIVTRGPAHLWQGPCGSIRHSETNLWALHDIQSISTGRMWHAHRSSFIYLWVLFLSQSFCESLCASPDTQYLDLLLSSPPVLVFTYLTLII